MDIHREIYDKDIATGAQAESAREKVRRWERENREMSIDEIDEMQANNEIHLESFNPFDSESVPSMPTTQGPSSSIQSNTSSAKCRK